MKKTWKWMAGILLTLVIVGAAAAAGYFWRANLLRGAYTGSYEGPILRAGVPGWRHGPMMRGDRFMPDTRPDLYGSRYFSPLNPFFLIGGLGRLALLGLLLYAAYWLGRRNARVVVEPVAPAASDKTPPASV